MSKRNSRVCPVRKTGSFDSRVRKWIQDLLRIPGPYIEEGKLESC